MTNPKSKITILSTFAKDIIFNLNGEIIRRQKGGPAYYITRVLNETGTPYSMRSFPTMTVEILIKEGNEFGKIPIVPPSLSIEYSTINSSYLFISSLLNEYDLTGINRYTGKLFLDVQGYVRDGQDFGKKKFWQTPNKLTNSFFCLKISDYELPYVSKSLIKSQKKKILLITYGKRGCLLYAFGKKYTINPNTIVDGKNTLGAGDTFFAYFVCQFINSDDALESARYATDKTTQFLSSQLTFHHTNSL